MIQEQDLLLGGSPKELLIKKTYSSFNTNSLIRFFDIILSLAFIIVLSPVLLVVLFVALIDTGAPIIFQKRVGKNKIVFQLIKFRTLHVGTIVKPSHELFGSEMSKIGLFLRKSKLDEMLQLFNVLKGDMSLVGPRPSLYTQTEVIFYRAKYNLYNFRPGLTGLSQIKGIKMSDPEKLALSDFDMMQSFNLFHYFKYLFITAIFLFRGKLFIE